MWSDTAVTTTGVREHASTFPLKDQEKQKSLYRTLVSVNSIVDDQTKFHDSDFEAVKKRYNCVFINNSVSEDIYDAIAAQRGSQIATRSKVSDNV